MERRVLQGLESALTDCPGSPRPVLSPTQPGPAGAPQNLNEKGQTPSEGLHVG